MSLSLPRSRRLLWLAAFGFLPACVLLLAIVNAVYAVPIGGVSIDATASATPADGSVTINVALAGPLAGTVTAQYTTVDGTATAPADYTAQSGTVIFAPGVPDQQITIAITNPGTGAPNKTFTVQLSNVSSPGWLVNATCTVTITEGTGSGPLPVSLSVVVVHDPYPNPVAVHKWTDVWLEAIAVSPAGLPLGTYANWSPWVVEEIKFSKESTGPWESVNFSKVSYGFASDPSTPPAASGTDVNGVVLSVKFDRTGYWRVKVKAAVQYLDGTGTFAAGSARRDLPVIFVGKKSDTVEIAKVQWAGVKMKDGKDNYFPNAAEMADKGGGDVLYAEQNNPTGWTSGGAPLDELHNEIRIKVTLTKAPPAGVDVPLYVEVFDPACYNPKYSMKKGIPGPSAHDNVDVNEQNGKQKVGTGSAIGLYDSSFDKIIGESGDSDDGIKRAEVVIKGDGTTKEVSVGMWIGDSGLQPGNNFIAAATADPKYFRNVAFDPKDFKTIKYKTDALVPKNQQTPMLTLWRTLYFQRDRMGEPVYTQGTYPSKFKKGTAKRSEGSEKVIYLGGAGVDFYTRNGCIGQFEGGRITLFKKDGTQIGKGPFRVKTSLRGSFQNQVHLFEEVPEGVHSFEELIDDDVLALEKAAPIKSADMRPDLELAEKWFPKACIKLNLVRTDLVEPNKSANRDDIPFQTNVMKKGEKGPTDYKKASEEVSSQFDGLATEYRKTKNERGFWVIYEFGAFQGDPLLDHDPRDEGALLGLALDQRDKNKGSYVFFAETTRDFVTTGKVKGDSVKLSFNVASKLVGVHEVGHLFGLAHDEKYGNIMIFGREFTATDGTIDSLEFTSLGYWMLMSNYTPGSRLIGEFP